MRRVAPVLALAALVSLAACSPEAPSTLDPRGPAADSIAGLWWLMLAAGTAVYVVTLGFLVVALRRRREASDRRDGVFVAVWGVAVPAAVLVALMVATVRVTGLTATPPGNPDVHVEVIGHQFWWEIRYPGEPFVTANEIRIPAGEPVRLTLESADVIHSFWVPQLHGKMDLVPGRTNTFWIEADEPGVFRGICAEYCGIQHARMHFLVVAEPRADFDAWLEARRQPPADPTDETARRGRDVFVGNNCAACHAVRGDTSARSPTALLDTDPAEAGPDLSDLGARLSLGAGILDNDRETLGAWILDPHALKPGVRMPATPLSDADLEALVTYLLGLE